MERTALVLGGGGLTGIAWQIGILTGLEAAGSDVTGADLVIGTSGGSVVGAQVTSSLPLSDLFKRQVDEYGREVATRIGWRVTAAFAKAMLRVGRDEVAFRKHVGAAAARAKTITEAERLSIIEGRLPVAEWPERDLRLVTVNVRTGLLRVFTREDATSGVRLAEAVAASCAVPLVWPSTTIGSDRYMDGAMRSPVNADLAAGYDRVLIIAPIMSGAGPMTDPLKQIDHLRTGGSRVVLIRPGKASEAAMGPNPLDPSRRGVAARAGFDQASAEAPGVHALLTEERGRAWGN